MRNIIAQGAEAIIYKDSDGNIVKERVSKGYRHPVLDMTLRKRRTRLEATLLREARVAGIATPQLADVTDYSIKMEPVEGKLVKGIIDEKNFANISKKIGIAIGRMHEFDIIHGDLTTSNMIYKNGEIFFIDFGLGSRSSRAEDKAVDLYLLYHALESTHWKIYKKAWKLILKKYAETYNGSGKVIKTLREIERRGRYKERPPAKKQLRRS
ncbi:MAG: Kae1-associated serine/threonine protein kinase [Candidatus Aenigmarchaeota archaeon]|nr:Kae1-associated serine/threonine protein kinase [Candidatus Aenigmarchaeota archaeon]